MNRMIDMWIKYVQKLSDFSQNSSVLTNYYNRILRRLQLYDSTIGSFRKWNITIGMNHMINVWMEYVQKLSDLFQNLNVLTNYSNRILKRLQFYDNTIGSFRRWYITYGMNHTIHMWMEYVQKLLFSYKIPMFGPLFLIVSFTETYQGYNPRSPIKFGTQCYFPLIGLKQIVCIFMLTNITILAFYTIWLGDVRISPGGLLLKPPLGQMRALIEINVHFKKLTPKRFQAPVF